LLVIVLAAAALGLTACGDASVSDVGVALACEALVKDKLRSPGTAEFGSIWDGENSTATDNGDGTWHVEGQVDSQNGFGAMVRSVFTCTIEVEGTEPVRKQVLKRPKAGNGQVEESARYEHGGPTS
jgi:hypothetical protein